MVDTSEKGTSHLTAEEERKKSDQEAMARANEKQRLIRKQLIEAKKIPQAQLDDLKVESEKIYEQLIRDSGGLFEEFKFVRQGDILHFLRQNLIISI